MAAPTVMQVVCFEPVGPEELGSRCVVVQWSDGSAGEAARWYDDEILLTEGDVLGKTHAEIRHLLHRRDVDYLTDA